MAELTHLAQVLAQTPVAERAQETERRQDQVRKQQATRRMADTAEIRGRQVEEAPEAGPLRLDPEKQGPGGNPPAAPGDTDAKKVGARETEDPGEEEKGGKIDLRA